MKYELVVETMILRMERVVVEAVDEDAAWKNVLAGEGETIKVASRTDEPRLIYIKEVE